MNYLTVRNVVQINVMAIAEHTPREQIGVKDANALDRAIKQPKQVVFERELYSGVYEKAGILMINLATKHPFYNGNKRTAWTAMDVFFRANGYITAFSDEEAISFTLKMVNFKGDFMELKKWTFDYLKNSPYITKN